MHMKIQIPRSEFGSRLREIRRKKGLTQGQLAEISGISSRMIVHYESHVKMPPLNKVKIIAEALGVSSDDLIGTTRRSKEQLQKEEVSHRIMKRIKVIEQLSIREQKAIFNFINTIVEKNKFKKELQAKKK